jgi:hypothetical protein
MIKCEDCGKEIDQINDKYYIIMNEDPNKPITQCELCTV